MRTLSKSLIGILLCFLCLVACSDHLFDNSGKGDSGAIRLSGNIRQENATRASDYGFVTGDRMGIFIVDYDDGVPGTLAASGNRASNVLYTFDGEEYVWSAPLEIYWRDSCTPIYPYYKSMTLQNAIAEAEEGDYIISHLDGFAEYVDGQWQGTMSSLTSGNGYLYKSSSKKAFEIDLFAQTAPSQAIMNDDTATQPTAMVDARIYPSTLNVIAVLSGDGTEVSEDCQVYAFVDNECRGVGRIINGKYFITVYGDVAATVKFLVKNLCTGKEYEAEGTLTFCEDVVGSVKEPMVLTMTPTAIRRIFDDSRKYKVYSVEGVMVKDGITADKFSELPRGIYIIDGQKVIIE